MSFVSNQGTDSVFGSCASINCWPLISKYHLNVWQPLLCRFCFGDCCCLVKKCTIHSNNLGRKVTFEKKERSSTDDKETSEESVRPLFKSWPLFFISFSNGCVFKVFNMRENVKLCLKWDQIEFGLLDTHIKQWLDNSLWINNLGKLFFPLLNH